MKWPLFTLLVVLLTICTGDQLTVPLNTNCTFYSSIASVVHDTELREIIVDLHGHRRCERPVFQVRLSGSALYLLELSKHDHQPLERGSSDSFIKQRKSTYHFTYPPIVDAGRYFLEILVIFCGGFNPSSFEQTCMEEHRHGANVVNAPYSVELPAAASLLATTQKPPRWLLSETQNPLYKNALLPTRYQHHYCGEGVVCERLRNEDDLWQYKLYNWVDAPSWHAAYRALGEPHTIVCFVGASHARGLTEHAQQLIQYANASLRLYFVHIDSRYPSEFNEAEVARHNCNYAVIGYGQWPLSFLAPAPCNADCFRTAITTLAPRLVSLNKQDKMKAYLRSMNYNGMGTFMTSCPPFDHRSPPAVAMYNGILREVSQQQNVPYIDTNHIMGPMWDSALDFCHPKGKVFNAEVEWILHRLFSDGGGSGN